MPGATGAAAARDGRWAVLALAIAARAANAAQFQSIGATGPALLADPSLGIAYSGLGALIGAYMLPGIVLALPAGWLIVRYGERRIALAGLALATIGGLLVAAAEGQGTALAGRALGGAGGVLLTVVAATLVMGRFAGSAALVPALGGILAAWPLGIALALMLLPALAEAASWRIAMLAVALICGASLAAGAIILTPARETGPRVEGGDGAACGRLGLRPGELGAVISSGIAWLGLNVGFAVLVGFLPAVLTDRGMSAASAGLLGSLASWAVIPLLPIGGALADRTGRPLLASCVLQLASAAAILVLALAPALPTLAAAALILAAGLLTAPPAPVIMSLPARALSPETRAIGMGLYYTLYYAGMAACPPLAGLARDVTGFVPAPLVLAALFHGVAIVGIAAYAMHIGRPHATHTIP